jgi:hypothetical protein
MLSEYDVQRIANAIVTKLVADDKFAKRIVKMMPKEERLLTSSQAAAILGISRFTVCRLADKLGGVRKEGKKSHWFFREDGLIDRYRRL